MFKVLGWLIGWNASKELASKATPMVDSLKELNYKKGIDELWNACVVIGDKIFGTCRIFQTVSVGGLIVAIFVSCILFLLVCIAILSIIGALTNVVNIENISVGSHTISK